MLFCQRFLKLSLIVGLVGVGVVLGVVAQTPLAGNKRDINTLMVERRDVLAKLVDVLKNRYERGLMQVDAYYKAQNELLSAELELAKTREDRLAALNSQLTNYQLLEKRALELQRVGAQGGQAEQVLSATAARLHAEIQILRESAAEKR